MIDYYSPLASYNNFRDFLSRLREYGEFDQYVITYLQECEQKRIIRVPGKGPYGEHGKDIVTVEDESTKSYCSYVVKSGDLDKNLDDPKYGVLKQMRDAMFIELEEAEFQNKRRAVVVVYNGREKKRSTIAKYETVKSQIDAEADEKAILLRGTERWNIDVFARKLYDFREIVAQMEECRRYNAFASDAINFILELDASIKGFSSSSVTAAQHAEEILRSSQTKIQAMKDSYGPFKKNEQE